VGDKEVVTEGRPVITVIVTLGVKVTETVLVSDCVPLARLVVAQAEGDWVNVLALVMAVGDMVYVFPLPEMDRVAVAAAVVTMGDGVWVKDRVFVTLMVGVTMPVVGAGLTECVAVAYMVKAVPVME
jgi:hypothetical protein